VQNNNKRTNRRLTVRGVERTVAEWSRVTGLKWSTIKERIRRGWGAEAAVLTPLRGAPRPVEPGEPLPEPPGVDGDPFAYD
jgi:hypothetical protein